MHLKLIFLINESINHRTHSYIWLKCVFISFWLHQTLHKDNCALLVCADFCSDQISLLNSEDNFHHIWNPIKISLVWWVPGLQSHLKSYKGPYVDGLVQERHNSSALAMELRLSCTNPLMLVTDLCFNSLAPGRPGCYFKTAMFDLVLLIGIFTLSNNNALRWMPWDLTDDKSTLVQVMAWCRQASSHYLSQWWPSSMSPYGVTRPQWVNTLISSCWIVLNIPKNVSTFPIISWILFNRRRPNSQ